MDDREGIGSAGSVPTDLEVIAAADKLSSLWMPNVSRPRAAGNQIHQRMAHGRLHVVTVETKRSPRHRRSEGR
jgi:hypothetical protein